MDLITHLKNQKEIDKHYIYFSSYVTKDSEKISNNYIMIGAIPSIFDLYQNKTSYMPLNPKYPTKWEATLSHVLYEIASDDNTQLKKYQ